MHGAGVRYSLNNVIQKILCFLGEKIQFLFIRELLAPIHSHKQNRKESSVRFLVLKNFSARRMQKPEEQKQPMQQ